MMRGVRQASRMVIVAAGAVAAVAGTARAELATAPVVDLKSTALVNKTAYIPPQCYTRTEAAAESAAAPTAGTASARAAHNPCFSCHVESRPPNYVNDPDLQTEWSLPGPALVNPWTNLFRDRSAAVASVEDDDILRYIRQSNYDDGKGGNLLASKLAQLPAAWDADGNGTWSGYVPDIAFHFDDQGFDIGADGPTGWRAFAYYPVNGTFWPTNGSTDDVLIRLPEIYRQAEDGTPDPAIYKINLAIVEALIKRQPVAIEPADETALGVDLDKDGRLDQALHIAFDWAPRDGRDMSWVGAARLARDRGEAPLAAGLYPLGTEFAHSVRYIDPGDDGDIRMAPRMKELRYMRKTRWLGFADRQEGALKEMKERALNPDQISLFFGSSETGVTNGTGWRLQGFIEDAAGELRPQSFEETVFCMGCHGGTGATDDDTFAFPRKLGATVAGGGWTHWTQHGLYRIPELIRADGAPEYAHYLRENGAGDELRGNAEVIARYLDDRGLLQPQAVAAFRSDVSQLLYPSRERALTLNKAYREIVREQSFIRGRDATVTPQANVSDRVEQGRPTGIDTPVSPWFHATRAAATAP